MVVVLASLMVVGCFEPEPKPTAVAGVSGVSVGPNGGVHPFDGEARFRLIRTIPAGALVSAEAGQLRLLAAPNGMLFGDDDEVEVRIAGQVEARTILQDADGIDWNLDFDMLSGCESGCEVLFDVTFVQLSDGEPPTFTWSAGVILTYRDVPPAAAFEMTMEREFLGPGGS